MSSRETDPKRYAAENFVLFSITAVAEMEETGPIVIHIAEGTMLVGMTTDAGWLVHPLFSYPKGQRGTYEPGADQVDAEYERLKHEIHRWPDLAEMKRQLEEQRAFQKRNR